MCQKINDFIIEWTLTMSKKLPVNICLLVVINPFIYIQYLLVRDYFSF